MLIINVKVPAARDRAAAVEFRSGKARLATGLAAASASTEIAARHGNAACDPLRPWGHPPLGAYQLLARGPAPAGSEAEYGTQVLVFLSARRAGQPRLTMRSARWPATPA